MSGSDVDERREAAADHYPLAPAPRRRGIASWSIDRPIGA